MDVLIEVIWDDMRVRTFIFEWITPIRWLQLKYFFCWIISKRLILTRYITAIDMNGEEPNAQYGRPSEALSMRSTTKKNVFKLNLIIGKKKICYTLCHFYVIIICHLIGILEIPVFPFMSCFNYVITALTARRCDTKMVAEWHDFPKRILIICHRANKVSV